MVTTFILGSIYGLVAIGMTLIYGTLRILDMSQGSMVMVGSFIGWGILVVAGWNPILAILARVRRDLHPRHASPSWSRCSR